MSENSGFHLFEGLGFVMKRKELILLVFALSLVVSYVLIYFLIEEQYEATAVLIPREEDASALAGGLLRSMRTLPLGFGGKSGRSDMDLYNTVMFSRTVMEDVIREFGLLHVYRLDTSRVDAMELAVKRLRKEISTRATEESAFEITVRAGSGQRASDMANYVIHRMNERIVDLNTGRSRENREFLGKRVDDISAHLKAAEDSLRVFQERSGLLDAKTQLQGIITANTTLETELEAKQLQESIMERMYDRESPQVKELQMQIEVYRKKLTQLRTQNEPGSPLLPLRELPQTAVEFLRRYRAVELDNLLLQYILPLYEQAKIEELRDYPVLQIIDAAVPPAKKSYPPRTLFSLVGAFSVTLLVLVILRVRQFLLDTHDPGWRRVLGEAKRWTWRGRKGVE
jgi:capsule polysaccharide export protein KpsE/RkpR